MYVRADILPQHTPCALDFHLFAHTGMKRHTHGQVSQHGIFDTVVRQRAEEGAYTERES